MDQQNNYNPLLDLLPCPAFLVRDGIVMQVNQAAEQTLISADTSVADYLGPQMPVYQAFTSGSLYLPLQLTGGTCGATVTALDHYHLFSLDSDNQVEQALALAAQQLRMPLNNLFSALERHERSDFTQQELYQLQRIITNMSDIPRYHEQFNARKECVELCGVFAEIVEKASVLLEQAGIRLEYTALPQCIAGVADREMLERAVYNLLSNAAKFSPKDKPVEAKLYSTGNLLCFTVYNQGDRIPPEVLSSIFKRHHRAPGIEDSRYGIGLGLALVKATALCHQGTVLIEQTESGGTKITMTLTVAKGSGTTLRSPIRLPFNDYAGGHDHGLLELSDILPSSSYKNI